MRPTPSDRPDNMRWRKGCGKFHEATHLSASDWDELQHTIRHRVLRYFHRQGLLERHGTDGMLTWQASGGFSIDASVHIPGRDRAGLERLLRYCARPPFALERLEANGYGAPGGERIVYRLPHPAPDGTTALSLTPLEFLERLALLIHPPRIHRHRYHGVLAPNPVPVRSILSYLDLPTQPPPLSPARAPPQGLFEFDQTGGFDPADPSRPARRPRHPRESVHTPGPRGGHRPAGPSGPGTMTWAGAVPPEPRARYGACSGGLGVAGGGEARLTGRSK